MTPPGRATVRDQRSADVFRALVECSRDAVAVLDTQSRLRYGNRALWRRLHRPSGELGLDDLLGLVHLDDVAEVRARLAEVMATPDRAVDLDFRARSRGGHLQYVEARAINRTEDAVVQGTVLTLHDAGERAHVARALRTSREGNRVLVRSLDETTLLHGMCDAIVHAGYRLAWVGYARNDPEHTVEPMAASGDTGYVDSLRISWADNEFGRGPTGVAIRTNEVQVEPDLRASAAFIPWRSRAAAHGFRTSCVLPLSRDGRVIGALNIYSGELGAFDGRALEVLQELADDLVYGIGRLRDAARVTAALDATVQALSTVSELRDPYTAGHQHRVGLLAEAIAHRMGVPAEQCIWIRVAGDLHDIGKIVVPAEILARPGRLSAGEMQIVREHPQAGFEILRGIEFPGQVAEMVLQHHERLDGSGYPRGLRGDEVLLGSRILAVADTIEAMTNHRPYRPALGPEQALAEIRAAAGTRLDPDAVAACVALFDTGEFSFVRTQDAPASQHWVQPLGVELTRSDPDCRETDRPG